MPSCEAGAMETTGGVAGANLHTLTVSMASMKRLLCRLDAAGEPVQANADLIRQAIEATRDESRRVDRVLKGLMQASEGVEGTPVTALSGALIVINDLIDALEGALRQVGG